MEQNCDDRRWHVVYTRQKSERKVALSISDLGIESYLPLHKVVRQWSDRKKKMEVPLFPNYVFVKVNEVKRAHLFSIKELVRFVSIERKPVVIQEKEISAIRKVLAEDVNVCAGEYFQDGTHVRIARGQLAGLEGIVVKQNSKFRLLIKINGLMKAFSVNVSSQMIEAIC